MKLNEQILLEYGASKEYIGEFNEEHNVEEYYFTIDLPKVEGFHVQECLISDTNVDVIKTGEYELTLFDTGLAKCNTLEELKIAYKVLSGSELHKKQLPKK